MSNVVGHEWVELLDSHEMRITRTSKGNFNYQIHIFEHVSLGFAGKPSMQVYYCRYQNCTRPDIELTRWTSLRGPHGHDIVLYMYTTVCSRVGPFTMSAPYYSAMYHAS